MTATHTLARALRAEARAICKAQPGYGTGRYRGDPYEAVALQQHAAQLESRQHFSTIPNDKRKSA